MQFQPTTEELLRLLPTYLTSEEKGRLLKALEQFKAEQGKDWSQKLGTNFYASGKSDFFLQGDLLRQIRFPAWNKQGKVFDKIYVNAIILSNTCDLDLANERNIPKEVVLAPVTPYQLFLEKFASRLSQKQVPTSLTDNIKAQVYSSLLYLPPVPGTQEDFVCHLDKAFWFPTEELNSYIPDIAQTRIASLDYFGYYLFLVKLSYHFCRVPEEKQR